MPIVVLIEPQANRENEGGVTGLCEHLNDYPGVFMERLFERTIGDQVVGIIADPNSLSKLLLAVHESAGDWLTGVGIGTLDIIGVSARECQGTALRTAKSAAEKARRTPGGVAIDGTSEYAQDIHSSAMLLADILDSRSARQREVARLRRADHICERIATELDITRRAVHKHLSAGRYALEQESCKLIDRLTARAEVSLSARGGIR